MNRPVLRFRYVRFGRPRARGGEPIVLTLRVPADTLSAWRATSVTEFVLPYRSPSRARQRLRRVQTQAGVRINRERAVHSLRHAFGTAVFATSGDLAAAQSLLGHADVSTTRGYVHRAARAQLRDVTAALPKLT